ARNLIGLPGRCGRTDARTSRKFDSQKVQHCTNRFLVILAEFFILYFEGFDSDPPEEIVPDFLLMFGFVQRLLDQIRIEFRFSQSGFALLHFPKSCLKCASCGQCLAQFVTSHDSQKTKTGKSSPQQLKVACRRISKTMCLSQMREKIIQVPAHQLETEHLVARYFCVHDSAHVPGVISNWVDSEFCGIARFGLRKKKLLRHSCPSGIAQSVREQIASRSRNRADHITAPRMTQLMKQASHLVYTSRFRTFSALSSMNCRRGSTTSPIRIVNILSASTALSSFRSTFSSLRFSGFMVVSNN